MPTHKYYTRLAAARANTEDKVDPFLKTDDWANELDELSALMDDDDFEEDIKDMVDELSDDETGNEEEMNETDLKRMIVQAVRSALPSVLSEMETELESEMMDEEEQDEDEYIRTLSREERKRIRRIEREIQQMNTSSVPLRYRVLGSNLPLSIKAIAIKRLETIQRMDSGTDEYNKLSNWLDGLLSIPFGVYVENPVNDKSSIQATSDYLTRVKAALDSSVYGHEEAKATLLEIVASGISNPASMPTVIALQGPPGTGKTCIVKDGVARALGRPFTMFALGGATDASILEGHSYTYTGSTWGRLVGMLMEAKCMNPIIYFDELDKISDTAKGSEIVNVLIHLIDPSQNNSIQDRYFAGVPLDFSRAIFIFSFNDETAIHPILRDRLHVIHTDPGSSSNKVIIARDYLIPKSLDNIGFHREDVVFSEDTIRYIIDRYTCEEGVRSLKRCIDSILMKLNTLRLTQGGPALSSSPNTTLLPYFLNNYKLPMTITPDTVDRLLRNTSLGRKREDRIPFMYT